MDITKRCVLYFKMKLCGQMCLVRFRSECSSVELCGLSSGSVSLAQTPRAEPPHVTSARLPSPSEMEQIRKHRQIKRMKFSLSYYS